MTNRLKYVKVSSHFPALKPEKASSLTKEWREDMDIPVKINQNGAPLSEATRAVVFVPDTIRNYPTFGESLARKIGAKLEIFAPLAVGDDSPCDKETIERLQAERLNDLYHGATAASLIDVTPGTIVVGNAIVEKRQPYTVIAPRYMEEFDPHDKKTILLPLGDGPAGLKATVFALWFAKRAGFKLVFWHTTWTNPNVVSDNPRDHMSHNAKLTLLKAETLAEEARVPYLTDVRSIPEAIADGIVAAAYDHDACLIVMTRGETAVFGSHCDSVVERTPIPLLVVA